MRAFQQLTIEAFQILFLIRNNISTNINPIIPANAEVDGTGAGRLQTFGRRLQTADRRLQTFGRRLKAGDSGMWTGDLCVVPTASQRGR